LINTYLVFVSLALFSISLINVSRASIDAILACSLCEWDVLRWVLSCSTVDTTEATSLVILEMSNSFVYFSFSVLKDSVQKSKIDERISTKCKLVKFVNKEEKVEKQLVILFWVCLESCGLREGNKKGMN